MFVQAGSSDTGRRFAARHAEAVFTAHMEKATAQAFYADLKALTAAEGRSPEQVLILPGLSPMIGATEAEAQRLAREPTTCPIRRWAASGCPAASAGMTSRTCRSTVRSSPQDFPATVVGRGGAQPHRGDPRASCGAKSRRCASCWRTLAGARGHFTFAGTPEQVADLIEDWFTDGAADGFNIMPPLLPAMLDVFSAEVIPLLQRRGLFRTAYAGTTLREHYGLPWPKSAFDEAALEKV